MNRVPLRRGMFASTTSYVPAIDDVAQPDGWLLLAIERATALQALFSRTRALGDRFYCRAVNHHDEEARLLDAAIADTPARTPDGVQAKAQRALRARDAAEGQP